MLEKNLPRTNLFLIITFQRSLQNTVDSRYPDPSYLDPITYVELISKSRLFSLCIYCISASRMSNYFYVDASAISSIIFSPWIYFSQFLLPRISNSDHDEGKQNVRCGAAGLSVNESHRQLINKSMFQFSLCPGNYKQHKQCLKSVIMKSRACRVGFDTRRSTPSRVIDL